MLIEVALQEEIDVWTQSWIDDGQILETCSLPANKHYSTLFRYIKEVTQKRKSTGHN